jgi:hypothetical protein
VEQSSEFFVSLPARGDYSGPPKFDVCSAGTAALQLLLQTSHRGCGRGAAGREGKDTLSFTDDRDNRRRRKSDPESDRSATASRSRKKRQAPGEVGHALRSAYQRMVEEDIPPEMLDLLGKLG